MGSNLKIVWLIPIKMGLKFKNRKGSRHKCRCEPFAILNLYLFLFTTAEDAVLVLDKSGLDLSTWVCWLQK